MFNPEGDFSLSKIFLAVRLTLMWNRQKAHVRLICDSARCNHLSSLTPERIASSSFCFKETVFQFSQTVAWQNDLK